MLVLYDLYEDKWGEGYKKEGKIMLLLFGRAGFYVIQATGIKDNFSCVLYAIPSCHFLVLCDKDVCYAGVE